MEDRIVYTDLTDKAVIEEIERIKDMATAEEKSRLDMKSLVPDHREKCIYGQMTGNCNSDRARELLDMDRDTMEDRKDLLFFRLSPLEKFIINSHPQLIEEIVLYIKGEREKLPYIDVNYNPFPPGRFTVFS